MRRTCEEMIDEVMEARLEDLDKLLRGTSKDWETPLEDYALCFDYIAPGTFADQGEGYFCYQMMWGGPSDEFRFFVSDDMTRLRIEYWFKDWFDGAHRDCSDKPVALHLWFWLFSRGSVTAALRLARQ